MSLDVMVLVGSLRAGSHTRRLVHALQRIAPAGLTLEITEIGQLPMFNVDLEAAPPPEWTAFQARVRRAEAVLFATPEHNRTIPAALKNAVDIGSRPAGRNAWARKPAAVVSVSTGALGGYGAHHHLRQALSHVDMPVLPQPEMYLGRIQDLVNDQAEFTAESTRQLCQKFLAAFEAWIPRFREGSSP